MFFIDSTETEEGKGRGRRETSIIASSTCRDQESNLRPFSAQDIDPNNWATQPGCIESLKILETQLTIQGGHLSGRQIG